MQSKFNVEVVDNYRKVNGLGVVEFCEKCHIDIKTYKKIINNEKYRKTALWKVARVMGISIKDLFVQEDNIEETSSNICEI